MNFFVKNINLKLMALALALALVSWYAVRETISFEITVADIPLEIQAGDGWSVLQQSADSVVVTFRGSQEDIRLMDQKQLRAIITLDSAAVDSVAEIALAPHHVSGSRGVRVVRINPERVSVSLDRESEKKLPVKARSTGRPFAGEIESLTCEPAIVNLRGPASQLANIEWVFTEPVDVEGRMESFQKRSRVLPPASLWSPRIEPPEVHVNVVIVQKTSSRTWNDVAVMALMPPGHSGQVSILPSRVQVTVSGAAEDVEALNNITPRVFVDGSQLDPSLTYDLPVSIHLPVGVPVTASADPAVVHIVMERQARKMKVDAPPAGTLDNLTP